MNAHDGRGDIDGIAVVIAGMTGAESAGTGWWFRLVRERVSVRVAVMPAVVARAAQMSVIEVQPSRLLMVTG